MTAKNFGGWVILPGHRAKHADGRPASQVRAIVRTTSQRKAAAAAGVSVGHVRTYWSETGNHRELAALDAYPPGTVLVRSMDPGGTVDGSTGFVPLLPHHQPRKATQ